MGLFGPRWLIWCELTSAVFEPEAVAIHLEDMDVVGKTIEQRAGETLGAEQAGPLWSAKLFRSGREKRKW